MASPAMGIAGLPLGPGRRAPSAGARPPKPNRAPRDLQGGASGSPSLRLTHSLTWLPADMARYGEETRARPRLQAPAAPLDEARDLERESANAAMERYAPGEDQPSPSCTTRSPRLHRCLRASRDLTRAEDLLQQTMLRIHRARGRFTPGRTSALGLRHRPPPVHRSDRRRKKRTERCRRHGRRRRARGGAAPASRRRADPLGAGGQAMAQPRTPRTDRVAFELIQPRASRSGRRPPSWAPPSPPSDAGPGPTWRFAWRWAMRSTLRGESRAGTPYQKHRTSRKQPSRRCSPAWSRRIVGSAIRAVSALAAPSLLFTLVGGARLGPRRAASSR